MASLGFTPADGSERRMLSFSAASSLLVTIMKSGAFIRHDCGGRAQCGTCRIELVTASAQPGTASGLSPMRAPESERLEALGIALDGRIRLACQTYSSRDVEARACLGKDDR
jgi:ferredoxin